MNRQYTPDDFRRAVDRIRAAQADAAITTDILVGFPGETENDFRLTLAVARHAGFSKIHAFPFSAIPGTAAWTYRREAPPPAVVRRRLAELAALERELAAAYRAQFVGRSMQALVERLPRGCRPGQAMTDRYVTIFFPDVGTRPGQVLAFRIEGVLSEGVTGRLEVRG
jgi:tRNA A37 methylthiotransferase MiaB